MRSEPVVGREVRFAMLKSALNTLARKGLGTALATAAVAGLGTTASGQDTTLPPQTDGETFLGSPDVVFDVSGRPCGGWSVSLEALSLKRRTSTDKLLAEERNYDLPDDPVVNSLTLGDGSSDSEIGGRLTLVREFDDCSRAEFVYFELNDVVPGSGQVPGGLDFDFGFRFLAVGGEFFGLRGFGFFGDFDTASGDMIGFSYTSNLRNVELNYQEVTYRSVSSDLNLGFGLRYLHLDEEFSLFALEDDGTHIDRVNARASNHMVGLQLKTAWDVALCDRVSLSTSGKAGLLLNMASQTTSRPTAAADFVGSGTSYTESDRDYELAGVLEVGVQVRGRLCDNVNLTAGYNVFYLSGVALAPDQLNSSSGEGSPTVDADGSSLYYGPSAGVEITWGGGR